MENRLLEKVEALIDQFRKEHNGESPLYVIVSPDENKQMMKLIKAANNYPEEQIVTSYKDIKIAEHPQQMNGDMYVSNELPETGS